MTRTILITGCSSGIGLEAARTFNARGWRVFAACRKPQDCARMVHEGFEAPQLDYADPASIRACVETVLGATGGTLDAVVNNGAFATPGALEDLPREALRDVFEANVFGWHDLTRLLIPAMRAQGHGRIVMIGSVLGHVVAPWRGAYNASKFALEGLTDTLRIEMRDTPIKVITLNVGPVTSRIRKNSIPSFERWIDWENSPRRAQYEAKLLKRLYEDRGPDRFERPPSAVAAQLIRALESDHPRPRYYVTFPARAMHALRRVLPTPALDWLLAKG